jgi:hypothetical protein
MRLDCCEPAKLLEEAISRKQDHDNSSDKMRPVLTGLYIAKLALASAEAQSCDDIKSQG